MDALTPLYPWLKAFHIVAAIAWMAGLLYLPRLFVYHADAEPGSAQAETFKTMERRLYRGIMWPAMVATLGLGAVLLAVPGLVDWRQGWMHGKLLLVLALVLLHLLMGRWRAEFAAGRNRRNARFYRLVNEAPTLLLIAIVVLVVVKPF
jgi:putative membrane protein